MFTLCVFILFLVRFGLLSGHLLGQSSVDHMFSFYFDYLYVTTWRCKEVCLGVVENFVDNLVFLGLFLLNFWVCDPVEYTSL